MDNLKRLDTSMKSMEKAAGVASMLEKVAVLGQYGAAPARKPSPNVAKAINNMKQMGPGALRAPKPRRQPFGMGSMARRPPAAPLAAPLAAPTAPFMAKKSSAHYVHSGLAQASAVLYENTYGDRMEKQAFKNPFSLWGGVGRTAAGAGGVGGLGMGLNRLRQLRTLAGEGAEGLAARKALGKKYNTNRIAKEQAKKEGKDFVPGAFDRSAQEVEFLRKARALKRSGKSFADAPMDYLKAYGPEVAKAALEGGGAAALLGGATRLASNWAKRKKMMDTAKAVAVPAALGLGGYALLKD